MFRTLLVIGLLIGAITDSEAQDAIKPPVMTPQWVVVTSSNPERLTMTLPNSDTSNLEPYTINIPIVKKNSAGEEEATIRTEVRWRQRDNPGKDAQLSKTLSWHVQALKFLDLQGNKLDFNKDVLPRLTKPMAAIAIDVPSLDPFFAHILKEDTTVVVVPAAL